MLARCLFAAALVVGSVSSAYAQVEGPKMFGKTADGKPVEVYTLKNKNGIIVKVMTLGATITEINVPDKKGKFANVVFGFDDVKGYESKDNQYFGCTVGRVANRIAKGRFTLDGKEYKLAINNEPNHLHGGVKKSLDKVVWNAKIIPPHPQRGGFPTLQFLYTSPDGEEGYPGKTDVRVTYSLRDRNVLFIDYYAVADKATPINLTNHSYFNLAGAGAETVLDHELQIEANKYVPVDQTLIPTGKVEAVKGTVFDFTKTTRIGERIEKLYETGAKGYDHCYALTRPEKRGEISLAAKMRDPKSGRVLEVITSQPGVQLYTGNFLFGQKGKDGKTYKQRSGVCLETGGLPDAVNQPTFPSIILRPGQTYRHTCVYAFSVE
ncbi:MAG: galactose mutarotase [Planctomycetes bacterium]|nr:galactose mutarotase [Planctomycetota bacterium]